jgi:hypothetical protein
MRRGVFNNGVSGPGRLQYAVSLVYNINFRDPMRCRAKGSRTHVRAVTGRQIVDAVFHQAPAANTGLIRSPASGSVQSKLDAA